MKITLNQDLGEVDSSRSSADSYELYDLEYVPSVFI